MDLAPAVQVEGATKRFGAVLALDAATLTVEQGSFLAVLGQSGSGKTTLLRAIAGLEQLDEGMISIGGCDMRGVPPQERPVNTVFQSYALFPHMTVRENVGFGLRIRRTDRSELDRRVERILDALGIAELAERKPAQISGGESQRVALARALVNEPQILLLDEPLSALDQRTRIKAREELRQIAAESRTSFIMVTHDQTDAFALSSRVALMSTGRVIQVGTPRQLYFEPDSVAAAEAFGVTNLLAGAVAGQGQPGEVQVDDLGMTLRTTTGGFARGQRVMVMIRPEALRFGSEPQPGCDSVAAVIEASRFVGSVVEYDLRLATGRRLLARRPEGENPYHYDAAPGFEVRAWWREDDAHTMAA